MTANENERRLPTAEDEARFWALLESAWVPLGADINRARLALAKRAPGDEVDASVFEDAVEVVVENLTDSCEGLSGEELTDLDRVLERKLYDIDRADVQEVTDGSDDGFLYARGFVLVLGRDFYEAVVRDPEMAVPDGECADMGYLFARLYGKRFGGFPETGSGISRESCSNPLGWQG